ncbi:aldo/keto reductase [Chondromyces apiculatus]|uniref:Oxidoreductases of the aldo/keto reductase family-like protein n=1 Tax=Chondromyces apiculatus DSM 436 TaxID=1192034 RepID=A0A017SZ82_9BACT|nr:aldo/keto reductase [Chondromyces apiculatus]EYF01591.1 oxidoreductases of the aldo/keto reductase family-like protein [Chondromyces apiculatus DSM 436]
MTCSWTPVRLGRTDLTVCPLGIAAAYGLSGRDVERAHERGVNLIYWGSSRTRDFGQAVKRIGDRDRASMTLVIQTYARSASGVGKSLDKALRALSLDHTDVLLLGWWNLPPQEHILDAAAEQVRLGRARSVMVSCHHRPTFKKLAADPRVDHLMLRYNAAHPGADRDVFPHLPDPRPGIVAYTATSWGQLLDRANVPVGEEIPTGSDCYRFVLSNPNIDACYTAPKNGDQLDEALRALDRGPLSEDELAWMRRIGVVARDRAQLQARGIGIADRLVNLVSGFGFRSTSQLPG